MIRDHSCPFFCFQAEDGIRDLTVTGVQTCALPIFEVIATAVGEANCVAQFASPTAVAMTSKGTLLVADTGNRRIRAVARRSEERRVGKEGRSRWSPYH